MAEGLLTQAAQARRVHALMQEVSRDFLLREELMTDPTTLVAEYTRREKVEFATAQGTNRLIFSIASSPGILQQLKIFFRQQKVDEKQFLRELSRAAVTSQDPLTVLSLAQSSSQQVPLRYDIAFSLLGTLLSTSSEGTGTPQTGIATATQTSTATQTALETQTTPETQTAPETQAATETQPATETQAATEQTLTFTQTFLPETNITGGTLTQQPHL